MKNFTKTILTTASAALISGAAFAGSHMAMEMTIVSWGGAYSKSVSYTHLTLPTKA